MDPKDRGLDFEERSGQYVRRNVLPSRQGWGPVEKQESVTKGRIDYTSYNPETKHLAVVEVKDKRALTRQDLQQVSRQTKGLAYDSIGNQLDFRKIEKTIVVSPKTTVTPEIRTEADARHIRIRRRRTY